MSAYLKELKDAVAKSSRQYEERKLNEISATRERLSPLDFRLARLLATIPHELQCQGLSLPTLQASLRGRWRGSCHAGELGTALRKLGFRRARRWVSREGFRSVWYPTK